MSFNTCRFCKKSESDYRKLVKYGVRHEAHHECYLKAGKSLDALHAWQVAAFPYRVLKKFGLEEKALEICKRDPEVMRSIREPLR